MSSLGHATTDPLGCFKDLPVQLQCCSGQVRHRRHRHSRQPGRADCRMVKLTEEDRQLPQRAPTSGQHAACGAA